jgi:hypothetical protein
MANRRVMKLFAVAMVASTAPAAADTTTQAVQSNQSTARKIDWQSQLQVAKITPRLLANGRAACGNTGGKVDEYPCERVLSVAERGLLAAARAYQNEEATPIIFPRRLANARPACGNTGGKEARPDDCTAADTRKAYAASKWWDQEAAKRQEKIQAARTILIAATEQAVRVDPTLAARLLPSGRPACGNTMSKSKPKACYTVAAEEE